MRATEVLVENLDDRIFTLLHRSGMYFLSPEALVSTVLELVTIRRWATGAGHHAHSETLRRMGFVAGPVIKFPERITDEMVEELRAIAIELGHQPGDRPARAAAWSQHWSECPTCQIGSTDQHCPTGRRLWDARPWAWQDAREGAPRRPQHV